MHYCQRCNVGVPVSGLNPHPHMCKKKSCLNYNVIVLFYYFNYFYSGPNKASVDDFWRMVWHEDIRTIAMLTKLMEGRKVHDNECVGAAARTWDNNFLKVGMFVCVCACVC